MLPNIQFIDWANRSILVVTKTLHIKLAFIIIAVKVASQNLHYAQFLAAGRERQALL